MPEPLTWTFDVFEPETEPEKPEPAATEYTPERLNSPNSLARLMQALFTTFRDEPEVYRRLKEIVAHWRDGPLPQAA